MALARPETLSIGEVLEVLSFQGGYNTNAVLAGSALLGLAAGVVGVFALLRKRSLVADAIGHATLPGIVIAFLVAVSLGASSRSLPVLLLGAAVAGFMAVVCIFGLLKFTRLREDAAIGIVLGVFFGVGVVLLSYVQRPENVSASPAGLHHFIYGQTAAMRAGDAMLMAGIALSAVVVTAVLFKEVALACFNDDYARVAGYPVGVLDGLVLGLVVLVTVAGLQAVGLILVIALLIIPPVAARLWTDRLLPLMVISGGLGALSGYIGAATSAVLPRAPAGSIIVLCGGGVFVVSLLVAPRHGVVAIASRRIVQRLRIAGDHLLEAAYEHENRAEGHNNYPDAHHPSHGAALGLARVARADGHRRPATKGYVQRTSDGYELTSTGAARGARIARNHRLWDQYLQTYADVRAGPRRLVGRHRRARAEPRACCRTRDRAACQGGEGMTLTPAGDLFPMLAAVLAALCCGLLGNFLVLRKLSLMGDAMSHSVLPGLVIAFMLTGVRTAPVMFLGATLAGVVTVVLVELIKRLGRVEPGAAMGVVFSVLFALGVLLIERAARNTDLDADCVLHGQLESLVWWEGPASLVGRHRWRGARCRPAPDLDPRHHFCPDPRARRGALQRTPAGRVRPRAGHRAGLQCHTPALRPDGVRRRCDGRGVRGRGLDPGHRHAHRARRDGPVADRPARPQLLVSVGVAIAAAILGYMGSIAVPHAVDRSEVNAAGSMAIMLGVLLSLAAIFGPRYGVLASSIRRVRMARRIALDDLLGRLYRQEEGEATVVRAPKPVLKRARRRGLLLADEIALSAEGRAQAAALVRRHRLWEAYLVDRAGLAADHVHAAAESLEHLPETLPPETGATDPHGKPIPPM